MAEYRDSIRRLVLTKDGPDSRSRAQSRHLDSRQVLDLCLAPSVVNCVKQVLQEDAVLWRSNFFPKPPGGALFDWHRDRDMWGDLLKPMINVTAWIAIDPATIENGCVEVIRRCDESEEREDVARAMELEPGQFFLFDDSVLHRSGPNRTERDRLGLAARFTLPHVAIDVNRLFPSYRSISVAKA